MLLAFLRCGACPAGVQLLTAHTGGPHSQRISPDRFLTSPGVVNTVIAGVAVVMPSSEWPPEDNGLDDLCETARNISRQLGATA